MTKMSWSQRGKKRSDSSTFHMKKPEMISHHGLGLPAGLLAKIYAGNALRLVPLAKGEN